MSTNLKYIFCKKFNSGYYF